MELNIDLWVLWVIGAVLLLVVEMMTPGVFVFACFAIAAFVTAICAAAGVSTAASWWIFLCLSIVAVVVARPLLAPLMNKTATPSNTDALIGQDALVLLPIAAHKPGKVKVRGEEWRAEAAEDLAENAIVTVERVEGTRLVVKLKKD